MMRVRRHHLIEEAKAELDLAYNEVKRAETGIMELEFEFNERMKAAQADRSDRGQIQALNEQKEHLQSEFDIEQLYDVQLAPGEVRWVRVSFDNGPDKIVTEPLEEGAGIALVEASTAAAER